MTGRRVRRALAAALVVFVVTTGVAAGVAAPAADPARTADGAARTAAAGPPVAFQQTTPNNTTVDRHQNPAGDAEQGNLSRVSTLLSKSLAARLGQSSVTLSRDQYELAKRLVGPEYRRDLGRYVEVTVRTETRADDQLAEQFNETSATQRRLADQLERFDETQAAYREARQTGNDSRAAALARELRQLADDIDRTRTTLVDDYRVISNRTAADLANETSVLNETVARRLTAARQIQTAEFAPTELELATNTTEASFRDPVQLRGRLTSNGSAVAAESIELGIGERRLETETDADGRFSVAYRPVTQPLGSQTLRVRYRPGPDTNRRTANDTVTVTLAQVQPDLSVAVDPVEARYNDTLRVTGDVTVDGVPVPAAPVTVSLGGETVATGETTRNGSVNESVPLSIRTANGTRPVRVVVGAPDAAVGVGEATEPVAVLASPANLDFNATLLNESGSARERRTVVVQGVLTTAADEPVGGEPIEILVEGTRVGVTRTDEGGEFETTVQIPASYLPNTVGGERRLRVVAAYRAEETNLRPTTALSNVVLQAELLAVIGRNLSAVRGLTAFFVIGSAVALRRRFARSDERVAAPPTEPATDDDTPAREPSTPASLLDLARRSLDGDRRDTAVLFGYAAVRAALTDAVDVRSDGTHWEFYHACADAGVDRREDLERLTALYEGAAFDSRETESAAASEALDLAATLLDAFDAESAGTDGPATTATGA